MIPPLPPMATVEHLPTIDCETYSEAGYVWLPDANKWGGLPGASGSKRGLPVVGVRVYAEHPTAEVITMSYDLLDGRGVRRWNPTMSLPADLFAYLASGGLIEAHNAGFEQTIWAVLCVPKYGFPPVNPAQWRCSAAKARAYGLPPSLEKLGEALGVDAQKDPEGKRLMRIFSMPRNPTKTNPARRITRADDPAQAEQYDLYCDRDVLAEQAASARLPALHPDELAYWLADQAVNRRGMAVDAVGVDDCCAVVDHALARADAELCVLTGGIRSSQTQQLIGWLAARGLHTGSIDADATDTLLGRDDLPADVRRVLEIRASAGSASVKKVYAMRNHTSSVGRIHDLYVYHGAATGRDTHADVQPGNLPKAGPALRWCESDGCGKPYNPTHGVCPWCGTDAAFSRPAPWSWEAVPHALEIMALRSADAVEWFFGDSLLTVSGCVRGLLCAAPGHELISSDYSSIEAVVAACLAGEQWRIDAFQRREDIYLHGAAGITGKTYQWYRENGGKKHPDRQKIGKPGELGLGFGGWVSAWRAFGGEGTDDEVKAKIVAWREASPAIVEMWGGQVRGKPWAPERPELFGLEGMAVAAILSPGQLFQYRQISYQVLDDVLLCTLPSGRRIAYQQPRLADGRWPGTYSISYMAWNTNPTMGALGWIRKETYSGRLFENVVQATARDVMRDAVTRLEAAGYPVVLRVHDELASEVPAGWGSIEEFERLMCVPAPWWQGWPIRADGGWRGIRYRKAD